MTDASPPRMSINRGGIRHVIQPAPTPSHHPAVWALVIDDMARRNDFGRVKYGTPLRAFNGRDVLRDAYEEALDLAVYLRQAIYERDNAKTAVDGPAEKNEIQF